MADPQDEKIAGFDVWHCALPVTSRRDHGIGSVAGTVEVIILRLVSESGAEGYGEAAPWRVFTGTPEASYAALSRYFRPLVVGRRVAERAAIVRAAHKAVVHCTEAKAALDTALHDLAGRLSGKSISALLGGCKHSTIALSCSIADPDFDADKALMRRLDEDGVRIVKLKAGFVGVDFDLQRLAYIRKTHPAFALRVDYNQALSRDEALKQVPEVAAFFPDFIEQPVRADDFRTMADLRDKTDVPLLADESVFGPEDMERAIDEGICDGVSVKIMKAGGLARAQQVAQMAGAAGLSAYGGDMFETGIAHLAGAHMIAATSEITLGCEFYQAKYFLAEDLLQTPFPIRNGHVVVPSGHGLGILPDLDKVRRYAIVTDESEAT